MRRGVRVPVSELVPDDSRLAVAEWEQVEAWRLRCLINAGYTVPLAEKIAASPVDLHHAVELVKQGCPPETAARILL